jgi:hypothetical protein
MIAPSLFESFVKFFHSFLFLILNNVLSGFYKKKEETGELLFYDIVIKLIALIFLKSHLPATPECSSPQ